MGEREREEHEVGTGETRKILYKASSWPVLPETRREGIPSEREASDSRNELATGTREGLTDPSGSIAHVLQRTALHTRVPTVPAAAQQSALSHVTSLILSLASQGKLASRRFHFISRQAKAR